MKLTTNQWFIVMTVAAFVAAIGGIQWYDYDSTGGKIATLVGIPVALFALWNVRKAKTSKFD